MGRTICALLTILVAGCATHVQLTQAPAQKLYRESGQPVYVALSAVGGDSCFREELSRYLSTPGGVQLATTNQRPIAVITGHLDRIEVHSNLGDKEVAMAYFTAFVITAPIAAVMYGTKDWRADAAAEGHLVATDSAGHILWQQSLTVSVSETQRTTPSQDALKTAMRGAVCQKLAAMLLNAFAEDLQRRTLGQAPEGR